MIRLCRFPADEIERRVALRRARQDVLTRSGAPEFWAVVDEAVLRRPLGGRETVRAQLRHLIEVAELPNITLQVVPFHVGVHAAAGGPFTILRFAEPDLPDIVYLEQLTSALSVSPTRSSILGSRQHARAGGRGCVTGVGGSGLEDTA